MKRLSLFVLVLVAAPLAAQEPGVKQTIAYVQKLQTENGGFRTDASKKTPSLRATSSALRALHYLGGELHNKAASAKFVESCYDTTVGGFSDTPAGKPDLFTTAVGVMAVTELKLSTEKFGSTRFLTAEAKTFEDIRIAAAALERLNAKSPKNDDWLKDILTLQSPDGTFGSGASQARATGGSVVTLLRLGGKVEKTDLILKTLKEGQRKNGGYGKDEDPSASDLETTYRVMRCFMMLKARPADVEGVRSFVAKCRNEDGGYGIAPGQASSIGGTYFAAIITHWLK